jgi:hypothetical protein
LWLLEPFPFVI